MTRREAFRAAGWSGAWLAARSAAQSAQETNAIAYREYSRCLPDAMRELASTALEKRNQQLRNLRTASHIHARQRWARETFWSLIGGKREATPLNVRTTGHIERDRYIVEKLVYEGRTGEWISANLYLPKIASAPFPGVVFQAGHSTNGKAAHTYQSCCQGLAQLGFAVLTFDPIGQGERTNYPGPNGLTRFPSADDEHTVPGRQLLLSGETMTRLQLEDAIKSLDVLASFPQVDRTRLASAGQSGGGTLTIMLAAVDDRLAAAVVSSGNTENVACDHFLPPGSVDDAEQNFVGSGPLGFDRWDLLWPIAPRPLMVLTSAMDFFYTYSPNYVRNGREEYNRLADAYRVLGYGERLWSWETPLPHALSYELRIELYRWLRKRLQPGAPEIDSEPPVSLEPDRELWATQSGSVVHDLRSLTAFAIVRARAAEIHTPTKPPDLREVLAIPRRAVPPRLDVLSTVESQKCNILAGEVQTSPTVWVPIWIFLPKTRAAKMAMVLDPNGRNQRCQEGDLYQTMAEKIVVCVPDLRGIGDLRPEYSAGAPAYASSHQTEESYAWASLIFGRSLLGQRVEDLLGAITAVQSHFDMPLSLLAARGPLTIPALCAASLESNIRQLYLAEHLVSWRAITEAENYNHPFANFVPGILAKTDLPQIADLIAPRNAVLAGSVDGAGNRVRAERVRESYPGWNFEIAETVDWTSQNLTLLSLR